MTCFKFAASLIQSAFLSWACNINFFIAVITTAVLLASALVCIHFHPSLIFESQAGASTCMPTSTKLGWKCTFTNVIDKNTAVLNTAVKKVYSTDP